MAASYPGSKKSFSAVVNGVTKLVAALFNSAYDEIEAIETDLLTGGVAPHGSIVMWSGAIASIPSGWLLCDGSLKSKTTYSALYAVCGTIHGAGDASNFNLPDLRDRFIVGAASDDSGVPKTTMTDGSTKTQSGASNIAAHAHDVTVYHGGTEIGAVSSYTASLNAQTASTQNAGSGTVTYPPYYALAFIIKY